MGFISPVATDSNGDAVATGSLQTLGKDDFLELLVTKLQYQDPLDPTDDEDFIAQLAQFSSLEQMSNIADGIETSNEWDYLQMQSMNNVMASGFIGKEIKAEYDGFWVDDSSQPSISYTTTEFASEIKFVVRDEDDNIVATITESDIGAGTNTFTWDGKDDLGNTVAEGYYTVEVTATTPSGSTFTPTLSLVGIVDSVVYRDGAAYLVIDGTEVALGNVAGIGEPGTFSES